MAAITQTEQPRGTGGGSTYSETPDQKRGWSKLADHVEGLLEEGRLFQGGQFTVQGYIAEMGLDNGKFYTEVIKDRTTGADTTITYTKTTAVIDDRRFTPEGVLLPLPMKKLKTSFFDGRMKDGSRSPTARGSMYHVHLAVTFNEPPADLVANKGKWDTLDYEGPQHRVLLVVDFGGWEAEGSQYFNSRASLKVFLNKFERDFDNKPSGNNVPPTQGSGAATSGVRASGRPASGRSAARPVEEEAPFAPSAVTGDEFDADPTPTPPPTRGRSRAASAGAAAGGSATAGSTAIASGVDAPATERQVRFVNTLLAELGDSVRHEEGTLTRKQASDLIDQLQRRRNEVA